MMRLRILILLLLVGTGVFGQSHRYEVYGLKFGERDKKVSISDIAVGATSKEKVAVYFMFWLLRGNGRMILVDAGFTNDADTRHITYTRPDSVLRRMNIEPDSITDIIVTHPHWDHIGGISLFPKAMVWMQEADYQYFVDSAWREGGQSGGFNRADVEKVLQRKQSGTLSLVKGDNIRILPGIKVFTGSKHTYESQYVRVHAATEDVVVASDNCKYYYNVITSLPSPATFSAEGYTENLERMRAMVSNVDLVIPGHDPLVMSKFPKVAEDIVRIR